MQESCPPPQTPPASSNRAGGLLGRCPRLGLRMSLAALDPDLKMDRIAGSSPPSSVVFPPVPEPRQKIVVKWIDTHLRQVESKAEFMQ